MADVYRGFPQYLDANLRIIPSKRPQQLPIAQRMKRETVGLVKCALKRMWKEAVVA
jgi:hypothetical protein